MTWLSVILSFFPTLVMLLGVVSFVWLCIEPSIFSAVALLAVFYVLPLLVYWLHHLFYPLKEGISYLEGKNYAPWWGTHQIQLIYIAFPALETILRLIPGLFSLWLRLWGAKVGQGVYWTSRLEIGDRSLLEIGDRVVFGHGIGIYSHAVKPKKDNLMLYAKRVKIGDGAFISAGCRLGPGVEIPAGAYVPVTTDLYPNQKWDEDTGTRR
ncbi:acyl transferase [Merismopedia glauca]|uniref:Acyl transferase n=1 Tax=Merismopedia glauca CCAP 1448/3 TaxID=1296344 RepID=A0A2T1CA84_9CYAN|nr:acyl transferase [Merismopedia glauca]PSB05161.1 acyl transferase [Merismopedia glauca CCAP 1448/3]